MEVTALALQQIAAQQNAGVSMVKQQAKSEQAVANLVQQAVDSGRGQNLDISI